MKIKQIFCKHKNISHIIIHDWYYDLMTDNDDLEDIPTYIIIEYCSNCGKIISQSFYNSDNIEEFFYKNPSSSNEDINKFEKLAGIKANDITMYHSYV